MSAIRRLGLAALLSLGSLPTWGEEAGITGAANVEVSGTPPGGSTSLLEVGRVVVRDEHIVSDANGLAQLLFLDQTTLTVGPNSDIVIDEFVYDPASKDGQLLMDASVGVFRLIGGDAATSGGITVGTPFATMGIRGSNVVIEISPNGRTRVTCNYCESVEIQLLSDPDKLVKIFGSDRFRTIEIGPDGFSAPFELTPEELAQLQDLLTSRPGQNGGVATIPVEPQVSQAVNGNNNSNNPPDQNDPNNPPLVQQGYNDQNIGNPKEQTEGGQDQNEQEAKDQGKGTGDGPPALLFTGGTFVSTPGLGTLAEGDEGWSGNLGDPDHTQAIASAELVEGQLVLTLAGGGTFTLPYQTGSFTIDPGEASSPAGALSGEGFVSPSGEFFYYTVFEEETGNADFLFGGQALATAGELGSIVAYELQPDALGGAVAFLSADMAAGIDPANVVTSPLYFVSEDPQGGTVVGTYGVAALGFEGTGPGQSSVLMVTVMDGVVSLEGDEVPFLEGVTRGFVSRPYDVPSGDWATEVRLASGSLSSIGDGDGNSFFGGEGGVFFVVGSGKWQSGDDFDVVYEYGIDDGGESFTAFEPINVATPSSAPLPPSVETERIDATRSGFAAGVAYDTAYGSVSPVAGTLALVLATEGASSATMDLETQNLIAADGLLFEFGNAVYVDRTQIMMQEAAGSEVDGGGVDGSLGAFVSYRLVAQPGDQLPGGATACACAFMEWGFWAYDVALGEGGSQITVPIGTWVAGDMAGEVDLPDSGSASYEGHAIANIVSSSEGVASSYVASGALSVEVDFTEGNRSLDGSITNLDGRNYSFDADYTGWNGDGTVQASGVSNDNNVDIDLTAGFFAGPQSPVQGIGGVFELQDNGNDAELDYVGSGTFAGEQVPQ
jgi:hypothetical protein